MGNAGPFPHALLRPPLAEWQVGYLQADPPHGRTELITPHGEYPKDEYSTSVLLLGFASAGLPLHIQVSASNSDATRIITLFEADPSEWAELRTRKSMATGNVPMPRLPRRNRQG